MQILFLLVSAFGFIDAAYLAQKHFTRDPLVCPFFGGCDQVTNSIYSEIYGIPVALFGAIYYALIFLFVLISFLSNKKIFLYLAVFLTPFGLLTSAILVFLMLVVIKAVCFYCVLSAASSTLLFVLGVVFLRLQWKTLRLKNSQKEIDKS